MQIRNVVVLEALRVTKSKVPVPIHGPWTAIQEELKELFKEGLLEMKGDEFVISPEGKKYILIFNDKCKELIEPFESYKKLVVDGNTIDGRLPIAAFSIRGQNLPEEVATDYLENLNVFLVWEQFFNWVRYQNKEGDEWQSTLLPSFKLHSQYNVRTDAWKNLGKTENSAIITATKQLMPVELVEITRA